MNSSNRNHSGDVKELRELRDREWLRLGLGCAAFKGCAGEVGMWWNEEKIKEVVAMKVCHGCSQCGTEWSKRFCWRNVCNELKICKVGARNE